MIAGLRPASAPPQAGQPAIPPLKSAAIVCAVIFAASLFGVFTRPVGQLAAFWPANAILLGLMMRDPSWARPQCWLGAAAGYLFADLAMSDDLLKTLLLTAANIVAVAAGYLIYMSLPAQHRGLRNPPAVLFLALTASGAAAVAGIAGAIINPMLFNGSAINGWIYWFVTELVNFIAILPVILAAPALSWFTVDRRKRPRDAIRITQAAPMTALFLSFALACLVGGPGGVAIPVPALLWCALTYRLFTTTLLTLGFSAFTLLAISAGMFSVDADLSTMHVILSIRLGVMLVSLAPLSVASVMISRNDLMERLQHVADHDSLTGALNRRAFRDRAGRLLEALATDRRPFAALMLDIDHFKAINDGYGHTAGDRVLENFTRTVRGCLRGSDLLGRLGGEEFAILLPDCDASNARIVAERIRVAFSDTDTELDDGRRVAATVSIGAVFAPNGAADLDQALQMADRALYRAKAGGRNRLESDTITTEG